MGSVESEDAVWNIEDPAEDTEREEEEILHLSPEDQVAEALEEDTEEALVPLQGAEAQAGKLDRPLSPSLL